MSPRVKPAETGSGLDQWHMGPQGPPCRARKVEHEGKDPRGARKVEREGTDPWGPIKRKGPRGARSQWKLSRFGLFGGLRGGLGGLGFVRGNCGCLGITELLVDGLEREAVAG